MSIEKKLTELGITLPDVSRAVGAYKPAAEAAGLVFVSGQVPVRDGKVVFSGKVGEDLTIQQAQEAAKLCAINALAAIKAQLGSLDKVGRIVRLEVFVNSGSGFTDQAQVANGASLLLHEIFGAEGQHARFAVGTAELPLNSAVELALIVEVERRKYQLI